MVAGPVHTIDGLLDWPHPKARGIVQPVEHPTLGLLDRLKAAGFALKFSAAETGYRGAAVPTGTQNREVFGELLGLSEAEMAARGGGLGRRHTPLVFRSAYTRPEELALRLTIQNACKKRQPLRWMGGRDIASKWAMSR